MSPIKEITPNLSPASESAGPAESLGAWLARTRAGYGAEPRDMARHLGLNPTIILALEADDFERLGPPVFVRGYLSRYARLLNLPESAVLEHYRQQVDAGREPPPLRVVYSRQRQTRVRDLRGVFYLLVVIGIGWAALRHLDELDPGRLLAWWPRNEQAGTPAPASKPMTVTTQTHYPFQPTAGEASHEPAPPPPSVPAPAPAVSEPPALPKPEPASAPVIAGLTPPVSVIATSAPAPASEPTSASVTPEVAGVPAAPTSAAQEENSPSSALDTRSGARLMLQFSEDCWVEVKDAQGKILISGLMKANTSRDLAGEAPFTVTLGNAPAARIALDDRPVDTAIYVPRRGTVSRFTLNSQP